MKEGSDCSICKKGATVRYFRRVQFNKVANNCPNYTNRAFSTKKVGAMLMYVSKEYIYNSFLLAHQHGGRDVTRKHYRFWETILNRRNGLETLLYAIF